MTPIRRVSELFNCYPWGVNNTRISFKTEMMGADTKKANAGKVVDPGLNKRKFFAGRTLSGKIVKDREGIYY